MAGFYPTGTADNPKLKEGRGKVKRQNEGVAWRRPGKGRTGPDCEKRKTAI